MKIAKGEIPSFRIWEDEWTLAFLDIQPVQPGHILVIPKIEVDEFFHVPEPYYSAVFQTARRISPALKRVTGAKRIVTTIQGWDVPHFHYHLIPSHGPSALSFSSARKATESELNEMCQKLIRELGK
jgi:histidine triad (HIT) family protein